MKLQLNVYLDKYGKLSGIDLTDDANGEVMLQIRTGKLVSFDEEGFNDLLQRRTPQLVSINVEYEEVDQQLD